MAPCGSSTPVLFFRRRQGTPLGFRFAHQHADLPLTAMPLSPQPAVAEFCLTSIDYRRLLGIPSIPYGLGAKGEGAIV
jgi:hypothetical protein